MRPSRGKAFVAFVLMLVLFVGALTLGAYRGWAGDRRQTLASADTLDSMIKARAELGHNIATVAKRHLAADAASLAALSQATQALAGQGDYTKKALSNEAFEKAAHTVLSELAGLETLQADERDKAYVTAMFPQALEQSEQLAKDAAYNAAAAAFNQRLAGSLSGRVAGALGVKPLILFEKAGGHQP